MDLAELLTHRPVPGAGVLLTLTPRCPLRCAHCSTASTMDGADPDAGPLRRFVGSFGPIDRPDVLMLTGGEPLLRPGLAAELAGTARRSGTRTALLTGGFVAAADRLPAPVRRVLDAVDHFSVSVDAYHERQVSRADAFRLLWTVLDAGVAASIHAVGTGPDDPYLADLAADARRVFGDRVPILANTVRPVGRAAAWAAARLSTVDGGAVLPCAMAAWPVVAADGTIVACCNQEVVDRRPVPAHLALGTVAADDWPTVRRRLLGSPVLRLIRAAGPVRLSGTAGRAGYCATCRGLSRDPSALAAAAGPAAGAAGEMLDRHAAALQVRAGPVAFVRRHGCPPYADLVALGGTRRRPEPTR